MSPFEPFLDRQAFVLLDGGLATTLEEAGHVLDSPLWSAKLLLDAPQDIREAHAAFLEAGADCITTASYQASLPGFTRLGIGTAQGEDVLRRSVALAAAATDEFWAVPQNREGRLKPLVAASVGPYGAFLADGSEYDGRYGVGIRALEAFHRPRLETLAATGTDVLAIETIPSAAEAEVLVGLLDELIHPGAWISFSCRDGAHLWDGTCIEDAVRLCDRGAGVVTVGVNCTAPRFVEELVRRVRATTHLPVVAYPNSGETYDPMHGAWVGAGAGQEWVDRAVAWHSAGARILGGCCRVSPGVLRALRRRLETEVHGSRKGA